MDKKHIELFESFLLQIQEVTMKALEELHKIPTNEIPEKQEQQQNFTFPTKEEIAEDDQDGDVPF